MHLDYLNPEFLTTAPADIIQAKPLSLDEMAEILDKIPRRLKAIELNPVDYVRIVEYFRHGKFTGTKILLSVAYCGIELRESKDVEPGDHRLVY